MDKQTEPKATLSPLQILIELLSAMKKPSILATDYERGLYDSSQVTKVKATELLTTEREYWLSMQAGAAKTLPSMNDVMERAHELDASHNSNNFLFHPSALDELINFSQGKNK